jgi:hypothetical protein
MADSNSLNEVDLIWAVKTSFIGYLEALEDGEISLESPARREVDGFVFSSSAAESNFDLASASGEVTFHGSVRFTGHWGALRVDICEPRLTLDSGVGHLAVRSGGVIGAPRWDAVATAEVIGRSETEISISLHLTAAGRMLLGQQYQVGQELDPAKVSFRAVG